MNYNFALNSYFPILIALYINAMPVNEAAAKGNVKIEGTVVYNEEELWESCLTS